jgi:hypothetical protein
MVILAINVVELKKKKTQWVLGFFSKILMSIECQSSKNNIEPFLHHGSKIGGILLYF